MIFVYAKALRAPKPGREHMASDGFFTCEHCGCETNARLRRCCDAGYRADCKPRTAESNTDTKGPKT